MDKMALKVDILALEVDILAEKNAGTAVGTFID